MSGQRAFITYSNIIIAVDEIESVSIGKSKVPGMEGKQTIRTILKNGTEWASSYDSDDDLLKTFGDIQKALGARVPDRGDVSMEGILSDQN